jgi:hypothetical protein
MIGAIVCVIAVLGFVSAIDNGKGLTPPSTLRTLFEVCVFRVHAAAGVLMCSGMALLESLW